MWQVGAGVEASPRRSSVVDNAEKTRIMKVS